MNIYKKVIFCVMFSVSTLYTTAVIKNTKKVPIGSTFSIVVSDNSGSTGYVWNIILTQALIDENITFQSTLVKPPAQPMPGAPSTREFIFSAKKLGTHTIYIQKWRQWSGDVAEVQQYDVTIE